METAVEYLYKNLLDNPMSNEDVIYNINVFDKAKEMEKQQIIDAYYGEAKSTEILDAEQYYNEQFKKK